MRDVAFWGMLALAAVALPVVLWQARRRRALLSVATGVAAFLITTWFIVFMLFTVDRDGRSAGAAFDCGRDCSLYQDLIGVTFLGLPIMLVVLVITTAAIAAIYSRHHFR